MGACVSSEYSSHSLALDQIPQSGAREQPQASQPSVPKSVKVLLLGSSGSGKTTVLKQMKSFHGERLSHWDIELYRQLIFVNLLSILEYLTGVTELLELDVSQDLTTRMNACPYIDLEDDQPFPVAYRDAIQDLWVSMGMQDMYDSGSLPSLPENWLYFSQHLDRLFHAAYVPTQEDIVHAYSKTTGIAEAAINLPSRPDVYLRLIDAGGRRSERKKWIHVFHNISVVVFLVNLNGYNQTLAEDRRTNSLMEDMNLWKAVCNSRWFTHASLILLLNKNDLFEKTLKRVPVKEYFPDYDGEPGDASDGRKYFLQRFRSVTQRRDTYIHLTTATDLSTFRYVMTALEDIILSLNLRNMDCVPALAL